MIKERNLDPSLRSQIESGLGNLGPRETWYVCKSTDDIYSYLGDRVDSTHLKTNITDAVAAAGDFDVIKVYPGTYTEGAVLNIDQKSLKLIAEGYGHGKGLSETYIQPYGGTYDGITVDASNVEIAGFGFVNAAGKSGIIVANGAGTGGVWIHDCYFYDVAQTGDYHVKVGSTSYNAVGTVVESCHFFKGKKFRLKIIKSLSCIALGYLLLFVSQRPFIRSWQKTARSGALDLKALED